MPIHSWADDLEPGALAQALDCTRLTTAFHHVALMADAHQGYGVPIGAVLALDGAISPYAVGNDIGCGMALVPTDVAVRDLLAPRVGGGSAAGSARERIMAEVQRTVPADPGPRPGRAAEAGLDVLLAGIQAAMREASGATGVPLSTSHSIRPPRGSALPGDLLLQRGRAQLGSLGAGNHFLELLAAPDGAVWLMLHSGSRGVGSLVCANFHRMALAACADRGVTPPAPGLAWLPLQGDPGSGAGRWERAGSCYRRAMDAALDYAQRNRAAMLAVVASAVERLFPAAVHLERTIGIHHNDATLEEHFGRRVWVHRKGAVKAARGSPTIVPGSMGTATYLGRGLGEPLSFASCSHGAGRMLSRGAARRLLSLERELEVVRSGGGKVFASSEAAVVDEMPGAYKDVDAVMAAQADLVEPLRRFTPLATYKGVERDRRRQGSRPVRRRPRR